LGHTWRLVTRQVSNKEWTCNCCCKCWERLHLQIWVCALGAGCEHWGIPGGWKPQTGE